MNTSRRVPSLLASGIGRTFFWASAVIGNAVGAANLNRQYLTPEGQSRRWPGWLPDSDGIIYSVDMTVFYNTFFSNPTATLALCLGLSSPRLMQPDDLAVVHKVSMELTAIFALTTRG